MSYLLPLPFHQWKPTDIHEFWLCYFLLLVAGCGVCHLYAYYLSLKWIWLPYFSTNLLHSARVIDQNPVSRCQQAVGIARQFFGCFISRKSWYVKHLAPEFYNWNSKNVVMYWFRTSILENVLQRCTIEENGDLMPNCEILKDCLRWLLISFIISQMNQCVI